MFHLTTASISSFSAPTKFCYVIRPKDARRAMTCDEMLNSRDKRVRIKRWYDFEVDCSRSKTREEKCPSLLGATPHANGKWSEVVDTTVCRGRLHISESLFGQIGLRGLTTVESLFRHTTQPWAIDRSDARDPRIICLLFTLARL